MNILSALPTWLTPTSYGSVITQVKKDHSLQRIYLDEEATHFLAGENTDQVVDELLQKNIFVDAIDLSKLSFKKKLRKEIGECIRKVSDNHWDLFSLYPLQFSIQTVNYCNAHCDFCYANMPSHKYVPHAMDVQTLYDLKDYAASYGSKIGISGGEPLLHPQIYDILAYRENEVYDTLITNFTADVDLDKLINTHVDLIQVSIHGYGTDHDSVLKIKDAYDRVKHRMKTVQPEINVATNTVITPSNLFSVEQMIIDLVKTFSHTQKNLTYLRFVPVIPSGYGIGTYKTSIQFIERVKELLSRMKKTFPHQHFEVPLIASNPYEYIQEKNFWMCPAGATVGVVDIDGHIVPCNQFIDTSIKSCSTIHTDRFQKIWMNDNMLSRFRYKLDQESAVTTCDECKYLVLKNGKEIK